MDYDFYVLHANNVQDLRAFDEKLSRKLLSKIYKST